MSGSALKFHLGSTMMNKTSTLNEHAMNNPDLAEQYRQKAVADKLRDQSVYNNNALNNIMTKEHSNIAQKASDLQLIKDKELEYLNMQRKQFELDELRKNLSTSNNIQNNNLNISPAVQKMMTKVNPTSNNVNNSNIKPNHDIVKQQMEHQRKINDKQIELLEMQQKALKHKFDMDAINQLQKLQQLKSEEENLIKSEQNIKKFNSHNSEKSKNFKDNISYSSMSSDVTIHDLNDVFSKSRNLDVSSDHQKITQIDTVDEDDISNKISLGGRSKKSRETQSRETKSKSSSKLGKKKNGISLNF